SRAAPSRFSLSRPGPHPALHSFPTRRSSDLRRSVQGDGRQRVAEGDRARVHEPVSGQYLGQEGFGLALAVDTHEAVTLIAAAVRSEEHTSELQSRFDLVCRLLLEKKKKADRE